GGGEAEASASGLAPRSTSGAYQMQDPFKAVIYDATGVLSGFELQAELEKRGCVPEMSDERYVVLLFSLGSRVEDADRLLAALREIDRKFPPGPIPAASVHVSTWNNFANSFISEPVQFSLRPVREEETERIKLEMSEGRIAAEMVVPYPPGIPLLYPGEVITGEISLRLQGLAAAGAKFQAASDPSLRMIQVYLTQEEV
ncbi:Orn/Lys/Arg family decarboxylase, partial [Paenibacillus zanthoxyli]